MSKIIIIGQSVTAVKLIEKIRSDDPDAEIIMIGFEQNLPSYSEHFIELLARKTDRQHVIYQNDSFYKNLRVEIINDKKISRINTKRKIVFFEGGEKVEADIMLIAGSDKTCYPDIKGTNKEGVFSLKTLDQVDKLLKMAGNFDSAVIESGSLAGITLAQALVRQEVETILCVPQKGILPEILDQTASNFIISLLEKTGVRVIRDCHVQEILGETDVKAVRLDVNKVIAAEAVFFPDAGYDLRLFNKGDLECADNRIKTDYFLETNIDNIFAIDEITESINFRPAVFFTEEERQIQVDRLYARIKKIQAEEIPFIPFYQVEISGYDLCVAGSMVYPDADFFIKIDDQGQLQARFCVKDSVIKGAFISNDAELGSRVRQLILTEGSVNLDDICSGCVKEDVNSDNELLPLKKEETVLDNRENSTGGNKLAGPDLLE